MQKCVLLKFMNTLTFDFNYMFNTLPSLFNFRRGILACCADGLVESAQSYYSGFTVSKCKV